MRTFYYKMFIFMTFWIYIAIWKFTFYRKVRKIPWKGTYIQERNGERVTSSNFRDNLKTEESVSKTKILQKTNLKKTMLNKSNDGLFCSLQSDWHLRYFSLPRKSDFKQWTFEEKQNCSNFQLEQISDIQPKYSFAMKCEDTRVAIYNKTRSKLKNRDIFRVNFGDLCLQTYINRCCKDHLPVPNVIHYVIYKKDELTFYEFVSFISVIRFVRPCAILIHGDKLPAGDYWNFIIMLSPNIVHVKRNPPNKIFGQKTLFKEHASDLMRIEALILYGGIYLDTDTVIVKSLEPLRKYPCTMSLQSSGYMSSAFIMAEQNATFLQKWLDGYKNHYRSKIYIFNAMVYPRNLANVSKDLIHVEMGKISRPWTQIGPKIYRTNWNWSVIYGIHLFSRSSGTRITMDFESVKYFNSTAGSVCRHVLFGNKELCFT